MTAQTPIYGIKYPVVGEPIRTTRQILEDNAKAVEAALLSGGVAAPGAGDVLAVSGRVSTIEGAWTAYNPNWTCSGLAPAVGNGTLSGRYRKVGRTVDLDVFLLFGSTTTGGTGNWSFTLPFATSADREHPFSIKLWCGSGNYVGAAYTPAGQSVVTPMAPLSATSSVLDIVRNANTSNTAGTGIPLVSGAYSFAANHNLSIYGRYEAAA